jgi:threonine-phosphate decarboxylase
MEPPQILRFVFQIQAKMTDTKTAKIESVSSFAYPKHGGDPRAVAELLGTNPDTLIDFSASINPLSPPSCVAQLLLETPRILREYPDPDCTVVTQKIAEATQIPKDWVRVTNGSTELIYLLPHLLTKEQEVAIIDPCFSEYKKSFVAGGFSPHSIALSADQDFQAEPSLIFPELDTIEQLGAIIIGNPASPTGKLYTTFMPLLQAYCGKRNIILIIDETFIEFSSAENSAWNLLQRNSNLVLIRSLTKFYSIPGLRIGYGVLHPEKIEKIIPHQYPWSVNALAQVIGAEVVLDRPFQEKTRNAIEHERAFMFQALNAIREIEVFSSEENFLLFRLRDNRPPLDLALYQYLISQSLLLRNCGNFCGLDDSFFRISLRERCENQKLVDSISRFFASRQRDVKK